MEIAPSVLAANFVRLEDEIRDVEQNGADLLHLDVMDGHFVPNISFGPPVIKSIRTVTNLPLDVHLMTYNPQDYLDVLESISGQNDTEHQRKEYQGRYRTESGYTDRSYRRSSSTIGLCAYHVRESGIWRSEIHYLYP